MAIPNDKIIQDELLKLLYKTEFKMLHCNVVYDELAKLFPELTEEEKTKKYKQSKSKWANCVQFARLRLVHSGYLLNAKETKNFGYWKLSNAGEEYTKSYLVKDNSSNNMLKKIDELIKSLENSKSIQEQFNPKDLTDSRERILTSIVQRRGETDFRQVLLYVYDSKCAISNCSLPEVLEVCYIIPCCGKETNKIQNSILLRSDIHTLFDLRLITIDEEKYSVIVSPKLKNTYYGQYQGKIINLPEKFELYPSKEVLKKHRGESNLS